MRSIKTKLILGISVLLIFLFAVTAFLLISEKERELTRDIYLEARGFSELTTPKIIDLYNTYLSQNSFFLFNREINDVFKKDPDINAIKIANFNGDLLYDSTAEKDRQYEGNPRVIDDSDLIARIKANNPSFLIEKTNRIVYLKKDAEGNFLFLNENEKPVPEIADTERIANIIYPFENKFAVIFGVTYEALQKRVLAMTERITYLLIFGVFLGLAFAYFFASRITEPIKKLTNVAVILGKGDFKQRVFVKGKDEVAVLGETFNKMARELEISTKALIYKERVAKELEVAAKIQKEILPKHMPDIEELDIAANLIPAAEIGGDCYDFIDIGDDSHLFYIGDVTGHGVPSGIVVSIANALLYSFSREKTLKEIAEATNKVLKAKTSPNMFLTLLMLKWNKQDKNAISYISAGHPEMLYYNAKEKKVSVAPGGGIALGMFPDISKNINEQKITLLSDDCLLMYSDGITEAVSENGKEMYGQSRLKRAFNEYAELPTADAMQKALLADVEEFIGKGTQADDITLVVIKRKI